jgi:SAM-dependent methyltransferase
MGHPGASRAGRDPCADPPCEPLVGMREVIPSAAMAPAQSLYATPRKIASAQGCHFYHVMEIPGYGLVETAQWDLRGRETAYLGDVDLAGKRVLEIGPASGYLTFFMESAGAEVVAVELSPDIDWDIVPDARVDLAAFVDERRKGIECIRNGFWFAHERFKSSAQVHYGNVYDLPDELGHFDIAVMGSVLLHVRDPLRVVENCARLADTLVITDVRYDDISDDRAVAECFSTSDTPTPDIWWRFSPQLFARFTEIMGFGYRSISFHDQFTVIGGPSIPSHMFTVVSSRFPSAVPSTQTSAN